MILGIPKTPAVHLAPTLGRSNNDRTPVELPMVIFLNRQPGKHLVEIGTFDRNETWNGFYLKHIEANSPAEALSKCRAIIAKCGFLGFAREKIFNKVEVYATPDMKVRACNIATLTIESEGRIYYSLLSGETRVRAEPGQATCILMDTWEPYFKPFKQ